MIKTFEQFLNENFNEKIIDTSVKLLARKLKRYKYDIVDLVDMEMDDLNVSIEDDGDTKGIHKSMFDTALGRKDYTIHVTYEVLNTLDTFKLVKFDIEDEDGVSVSSEMLGITENTEEDLFGVRYMK
jgi:hypothetical protein